MRTWASCARQRACSSPGAGCASCRCSCTCGSRTRPIPQRSPAIRRASTPAPRCGACAAGTTGSGVTTTSSACRAACSRTRRRSTSGCCSSWTRPRWTRTATCASRSCSAGAADDDVARMMSDPARTPGRPRCLVLLPRPAWPLDDGGRVGLWQGLRDVAGAFATRALVMRRPAERGESVPAAVRELGIDVTFVDHAPPPAPIALAQGVMGRWPYMLARFRSAAFAHAVRDVVARWQPDLAYIHHLHLATYADGLQGCALVLRQHNLEQLWLERFARTTPNPAVAAYARLQVARMRRAEAELCRRMDLVLAVHAEEAAAMRAFAPDVRVEVIPASARFQPLERRARGPAPTLLVVGSYDHEGNAEGARVFLEQGWPAVRARRPDARLRLVGRHIPPALAALAKR